MFTLSKKFSKPVATRICKAHRVSTINQYEHCWKQFQDWIKTNEVATISESVILDFLDHLVSNSQLSPKTTLVYRSALYLPLIHGFNISTKSEEFSLLAKAHFIANPPLRRIVPQWSLTKVLELLSSTRFQSEISLKDLCLKTLFLLALASGNRCSELSSLDRHSINFSPNGDVTLTVVPNFLYKNERIDNCPPNINFPALLNADGSHHELCPVQSLKEWLEKTSSYEGNKIFINPLTMKPMTSASVSRHLVEIINTADPGKFAKGHDVRKIATSLAWTRGLPMPSIIKRAFWKSSNIFIRKYLNPIKTPLGPCVALGHKITAM